VGVDPGHVFRTALKGYTARLTRAQVRALRADPQVASVEPNRILHAMDTLAPGESVPTGVGRIGAASSSAGTANPASSAAVAVIDTGTDLDHPDLNVGTGTNCINSAVPPNDDNGHGTHVSGTIAGDGDGTTPAGRGVAPGAGLVGVKVLDANGDGFTSDVVAGIQWVTLNKATYGIEVLNISLGSEGCGDGLEPDSVAVNAAYAAGLVVNVAAGNDGPGACTIGSPGDAKDALTVGAMADLGANGFKQADFSSRGPTADGRVKPDISAPGVSITSAAANTTNGYTTMNGTSMATPFVSGVALLMLDADPTFVNDDVKSAITSTAVDWGRGGDNTEPGSSGPDDDYGAGRLDAYAALAVADPNLTSGPPEPNHSLREGSLPGTGSSLEYTVDVASTSFPIAATMIDLSSDCASGGSQPDFDLTLRDPGGNIVAFAASSQRQDELGYLPATTGVYRLRVTSFHDCGDFFMDVSGGEVSVQGTASQPDPGPDTTQPSQPAPTPTTPSNDPAPVATAALVNAAKLNAKRAASSLKKSGLRRLLKKGSFVLRGLAPSAGRLELVVRTSYHHHTVTVAKLTRKVGSAGHPRLTVKLTRSGKRLVKRPGRLRFTVVAAVVDGATARRERATYRVLVRR
jgi:serine protease AprX